MLTSRSYTALYGFLQVFIYGFLRLFHVSLRLFYTAFGSVVGGNTGHGNLVYFCKNVILKCVVKINYQLQCYSAVTAAAALTKGCVLSVGIIALC